MSFCLSFLGGHFYILLGHYTLGAHTREPPWGGYSWCPLWAHLGGHLPLLFTFGAFLQTPTMFWGPHTQEGVFVFGPFCPPFYFCPTTGVFYFWDPPKGGPPTLHCFSPPGGFGLPNTQHLGTGQGPFHLVW